MRWRAGWWRVWGKQHLRVQRACLMWSPALAAPLGWAAWWQAVWRSLLLLQHLTTAVSLIVCWLRSGQLSTFTLHTSLSCLRVSTTRLPVLLCKYKYLSLTQTGFRTALKNWGMSFHFVQLYEMHSNGIIMVTGGDAHMQIKIQRYVHMWVVHTQGKFRLNTKQISEAAWMHTNPVERWT